MKFLILLLTAALSSNLYAQDQEDDFMDVEEFDMEARPAEVPPAPKRPNAPSSSTQQNEVQVRDQKRKIEIKSSTVKAPSEPGTSEPRFDWSKYKGQDQVPHPDAEKGLIRITKDKTYIYGVKESEQKRAAGFRLGYFDPINLENPDTAGQANSTFEENYDETSNPALLVDYEWQLFRFGLGKFGLKVGSGVYFAQGHGHFESGSALEPRERFTLLVFPNSLGGVARFQAWDRQLFVPYVDGGITAFAFTEFRDDDKGPKFGGALASYWAAGGQLNLSYFDALSRVQLDREYGINRIYLVGEYRNIIALSNKFDFSSDLINGGFLMEF